LILLILVAAGGYILVYRREMIKPIQVGPTPTPTPTAGDVMAQAKALYQAGDLDVEGVGIHLEDAGGRGRHQEVG
jgi:hypothetical protein